MNVVAWVLVAFGILKGAIELIPLARRTSARSLATLEQFGSAMPPAQWDRTVSFIRRQRLWGGGFSLAGSLATLILGLAIAPVTGELITSVASAFIVGVAIYAGGFIAAGRDARHRGTLSALERDTRKLSLRDYASRGERIILYVGQGFLVVGMITLLFMFMRLTPAADGGWELVVGLSFVAHFFATAVTTAVGRRFVLTRTLFASSGDELAWEDTLRASVLLPSVTVLTFNFFLITTSLNTVLASMSYDEPRFVFSNIVFALTGIGLVLLIASVISQTSTAKRQPHMLTHLWPEVAATRAAAPTPVQSEVVAP